MNNRELALEQALIAVLAAAKASNVDIDNLVNNARSVVLDSAHSSNIVDDKSIRVASCEELEAAASKV
ncbi:hypothetical protein C3374_22540 [Pantoea sp. PSNIH4]|nr:hypothetical protein C3380_19645 [Pantoea sp. PSNIH5]POU59223.1 hypothetical protein C3374_22540 [Pantoea sp. PSNIH4]POY65734.1 hypothetical protein C3402_21865 [Pantoea sp. PSNIH3]